MCENASPVRSILRYRFCLYCTWHGRTDTPGYPQIFVSWLYSAAVSWARKYSSTRIPSREWNIP